MKYDSLSRVTVTYWVYFAGRTKNDVQSEGKYIFTFRLHVIFYHCHCGLLTKILFSDFEATSENPDQVHLSSFYC
jgi:hypothetical protein